MAQINLPVDWQDAEAQANLAAIQGNQSQLLPTVQAIGSNIANTVANPSNLVPEVPTLTKEDVLNHLLGANGQDRYQLWPERLIRDAATAPGNVLASKTPLTSQDLIKPAMDVAALSGTGGIAGTGEGAGTALGAGPFLRPALKYEGKIYKAPVGGEHMDAIPQNLRAEFTRQAMSGEDISNFDFGFMNHKGQFLNRENALKYAIDNGLLSPHDARYGALTSTMDFKPAVETPKFDNPSKLMDWSPAIKVKDKIYKGQDHPTIQEKNQLYGVSQTDGFVDSKGNFLNRNDFNKKFGTNESDDLNSIKEVLKNNPSSNIKDYVAAVRDPDTGKIFSGKSINDSHPDVMTKSNSKYWNKYQSDFKKYYEEDNDAALEDLVEASQPHQGFSDKNNNYLSRMDFMKKFGIAASEDLKNLGAQ